MREWRTGPAMPFFKYKKICWKMVCVFAAGTILLTVAATALGMYLGSLIGAVIGWIYSMGMLWVILDYFGYLLDNEKVKEIRDNVSDYENLQILPDGSLEREPVKTNT
jgi:hypothetical protein